MPAGRPSKYTPELLDAAQAYLENYEDAGDPVPSVVGLAIAIGINKATCYDWAKHDDKQAFSDILTRVEEMQEQKLIAGGLSQGFNPAITKMMLTKHGYSDKLQTENTHDVSDPMKELLGYVASSGKRVGDD